LAIDVENSEIVGTYVGSRAEQKKEHQIFAIPYHRLTGVWTEGDKGHETSHQTIQRVSLEGGKKNT